MDNGWSSWCEALVTANSSRDGDDGPWSTFNFSIGAEPQNVRLLPSTSRACLMPFESVACEQMSCSHTATFSANESSSWQGNTFGQCPARFDSEWYYAPSCQWGTDSVTFGTTRTNIKETFITPMTTASNYSMTTVSNYSIGMFGLLPANISTDSGTRNYSGFIFELKKSGATNVNGWSYTAGSFNKDQPGSFMFGGYDQLRFDQSPSKSLLISGLGLGLPSYLNVSVQSITDPNINSGALLVPAPLREVEINTGIPDIWLPETTCQQLEAAYNLQWNSSLNYYFINESHHNTLLNSNPTLQFQITASQSGSEAITITLPYELLYLNKTINGQSLRYFAIRKARTESNVLGRAFMQSAHLIVNHDNGTFRISQALFPGKGTKPVLKSILEVETKRISTAAIVGVTLGSIIILCTSLTVAVRNYRKKQMQVTPSPTKMPPTSLLHESFKPELPVLSSPATYCPPPAYRRRQSSNATMLSEVDATDTMIMSRVDCLPGINEAPERKTPVDAPLAELEGCAVNMAELDAGFVGIEALAATPAEGQMQNHESLITTLQEDELCGDEAMSDTNTEYRTAGGSTSEGLVSPLNSRAVSRSCSRSRSYY